MCKSIKHFIMSGERHSDIYRKALINRVKGLNYHQRGHALKSILDGVSPRKAIMDAERYHLTEKEKT